MTLTCWWCSRPFRRSIPAVVKDPLDNKHLTHKGCADHARESFKHSTSLPECSEYIVGRFGYLTKPTNQE